MSRTAHTQWRLEIADISATIAQDDGEMVSLAFLGPDRVVACGLDGRITIFGPLHNGVVSSLRIAAPPSTDVEEEEDDDGYPPTVSSFQVSCSEGKIIFATCFDGAHEVDVQSFNQQALELPPRCDDMASMCSNMPEEVLCRERTLTKLKGHTGVVNSVNLDANLAITASDDLTVRIWTIEEDGLRVSIPHPKVVYDAGFFHGHEQALLFTLSNDGFVRFFNMQHSLTSPSRCIAVRDASRTALAAAKGEEALLAIAEFLEVRVYDATSGTMVARCVFPEAVRRVHSIEFMFPPEFYLICGCEDGQLVLVNLASNYAEGFDLHASDRRYGLRGGVSVIRGEPQKNYIAYAFAKGTWGIGQLLEQEEEKDTWV